MTVYLVRTDLSAGVTTAHDEQVLDWAPGSQAATIDCGTDFFQGWRPTAPAAELLVLAAAAYCIDKTHARSGADDAWTRDLGVRLPVQSPTAFDGPAFDRSFGFLTGDRWDITAYRSTLDPLAALPLLHQPLIPFVDVDAVSLFSGGLDSLCGVIDLLEGDPTLRLGLISHYDGGQASSKQTVLRTRLAAEYGSDRVVLRRLWLRPAAEDVRQEHPAGPAVETTTRGRSLLFLAAALALASSVGPNAPVYLPENGYIAVNVPLSRARTGSVSTRTTHPHFLRLLGDAAAAHGVTNPLVNPYVFATKGEMLRDSRNPGLLRELVPITVSCSHPEAARMQQRAQGNCGYCFPCLIRRSSLAVPDWDDEEYPWDVLTDPSLVTEVDEDRGADLRAVLNGVFADRPDSDLLRNAPLPSGSHAEHLSVWRRGNAELRAWLESGAEGELAEIVERIR